MCGIVGYVGGRDAVPVILDGLRRLEYRGYDSAGIAVVREGTLHRRRSAGKLGNLAASLAREPLSGEWGVGHTRWATHGRPTEENAHPHQDCAGRIVVVHNGIIENHLELKARLGAAGHRFVTQTDTEVVAHLVESLYRGSLEDAAREALGQIQGVYAVVLLHRDEPQRLVAARMGPPLVVGLGSDEHFVASDIPALLPHTRDFVFLEDGDVATVTPQGVRVTTLAGAVATRAPQRVLWDPVQAEKGGYRHFMLKEIHEQPRAMRDTLLGRISLEEALKLKEISYLHAEGYPAGEMKHGPITLVDEDLPVVALCPAGHVYEKMLSNVQEAKARGGRVIAVAAAGDPALAQLLDGPGDARLEIPACPELWSPFLTVIPLQLLAYHVALRAGRDVDQPRNLAKSVTVE